MTNSKLTLGLIVQCFLLVEVTTSVFSRYNTGDIKWDQPNAEVPKQTGPATGTLFTSYLRGVGAGLFSKHWFCLLEGQVEYITY